MRNYIFFVFFLASELLIAQEMISSGRLSINFDDFGITSIKDNGVEVLNTLTSSPYFDLQIRNVNTNEERTIHPSDWSKVSVINTGDAAVIELTSPIDANLPNSLMAKISISTFDEKSSWDLSITGLGNYSLLETNFPKLNIKADGNDSFFIPYYSGKIIENPGTVIDYFDDPENNFDNLTGIYPRGWGATMQYMAYYNENYGLYFGFHDPKASLKQFGARDAEGGVRVNCKIPIPNKTLAGNDWEMEGHFQLDLFDGDWFDAALLYKDWAATKAEYWPQHSPKRTARQAIFGNIGVWAYNYLSDVSGNLAVHEGLINEFADFMEIPVGIHWYRWNYLEFDDDYPKYFPERTGLEDLVSNTQGANENILTMPYINGRMYDTDLEDFNIEGLPYATKREDGSIYTQPFNGNTFAVMCPSQSNWQEKIVDAAHQITDRIGTAGIYIDMVAAASPAQCMDSNHSHPIGGGSYWREGYKEMFNKIYLGIGDDKFITVEGGCDFLADEVDAFMVQGWTTSNQVPAFSVVYSGKVQLFGTQTGTSRYGQQQFYGKLAQNFSFGTQTGRQSISIALNLANANDDKIMAVNYVKSLGQMRHRLKNFMSFGQMKRPIKIEGAVPILDFQVLDAGVSIPANISAIQTSTWQHGDSLVIVFANAKIQSPAGVEGGQLDFSFDFDGSLYGMDGNFNIQEIKPNVNGEIINHPNSFTKNVSLSNLELVAYLITPATTTAISSNPTSFFILYPNPSNDKVVINGVFNKHNVILSDIRGTIVSNYSNISNPLTIDLSNLGAGVYFISIQNSDNIEEGIYKLIKQ